MHTFPFGLAARRRAPRGAGVAQRAQAAGLGRGGQHPWHGPPAIERAATRLDVELAHEARELLRSIAALGTRRRTALTLRAAGFSYREIQQLLGVTYTWVNRHVNGGPAGARASRSHRRRGG